MTPTSHGHKLPACASLPRPFRRSLEATLPTPESAEAFAKFLEARERLNGITKELNEAHSRQHASSDGRQRYEQLQKAWQEAFADFETKTNEFAAAVVGAKKQLAGEKD